MKLPPENNQYNSFLSKYPSFSAIFVSVIFLLCTYWSAVIYGFGGAMVVFISLAVMGLFGMPFIFGLPNGRKSFSAYTRDIWLRTDNPLGGDILLGISSAVLLLASLLFSSLTTGDLYIDFDKVDGFQIFTGLTHGIWEEVFFRGVILALFYRIRPGKLSAFALASGLFAVVHFDAYNFLRLFLVGLFWCYMTFESGSLLPAIISHSIFDIFSVAFVPNISGDSIYLWLIVWQVLNGIAILVGLLFVRWAVQKKNLRETRNNLGML